MPVRCLLIGAVSLLLSGVAWADAKTTIAQLKKLPESRRITGFQTVLADRRTPKADLPDLRKALAEEIRDYSPLYSKQPFPYDVSRWVRLLAAGDKQELTDPVIAPALLGIYLDRNELDQAESLAKAFHAAHQDNHMANAAVAWCASKGALPEKPLLFPVHFCVLTRNPGAAMAATEAQCRKECDILNAGFRTLKGGALVRFEFKGWTPYEAIRTSDSPFVQCGDAQEPHNIGKLDEAFNACNDARIRDKKAINFYIVDSFTQKEGFKDVTSHGRRNSNRPYVLIDWQRLDNNVQNPEVHEMGHAFGLEHVAVPGATGKTSTNIMCSAGEGAGSGGLRDLGFTPAQSALILRHAARTHSRLGLRAE